MNAKEQAGGIVVDEFGVCEPSGICELVSGVPWVRLLPRVRAVSRSVFVLLGLCWVDVVSGYCVLISK